jgi:hypothetical protein
MGFFVNSVAVLMLLITEQLEQNLTCNSFLDTNPLVKFIHLKKNVHVQYFAKYVSLSVVTFGPYT